MGGVGWGWSEGKEGMYFGLAHGSLVPEQDVMRVGHLAHKLLAKPLSVDGGEAGVVHLHPQP